MAQLMLSRAVSSGDVPDYMKNELSDFKLVFSQFEGKFEKIDKNFVDPVTDSDPDKIERLIEKKATSMAREMSSINKQILASGAIISMMQTYPLIVKAMRNTLNDAKKSLDQKSIENFADALFLSLKDEMYFMTKYYPLFSTQRTLPKQLKQSGISKAELSRTNGKLLLAMFAGLNILFKADSKKYRKAFDVISNLFSQYTEEKDTEISTLDILFDDKKRIDFDERLASIQELVSRKT